MSRHYFIFISITKIAFSFSSLFLDSPLSRYPAIGSDHTHPTSERETQPRNLEIINNRSGNIETTSGQFHLPSLLRLYPSSISPFTYISLLPFFGEREREEDPSGRVEWNFECLHTLTIYTYSNLTVAEISFLAEHRKMNETANTS